MTSLIELKERATLLLVAARKQLLEEGQIIPMIILGDNDEGGMTVAVLEPEVMNDQAAKRIAALGLKKQVEERGFRYAIILSDMFGLKLKKEEKFTYELARLQGVTGLREIHELFKIGVLNEEVRVMIQTKSSGGAVLSIEYIKVDDKVVSTGAIVEKPAQHDGVFNFFEPKQGT